MRGPDLSIVYCNDAYAHAVDQPTPEAAIAEGSEIAGGPMGWGKDLAEEARDGGAGRTRSTYVVMGGERCMLEITESPLVGGGYWSMAGFAIDCTDQDIARSELARHIASHGEVLESLGTGIVVFGPDTRLQFYNIAFARMWEYDPEWLRSLPTHGEMLEDLRARRAYPDQADFQAFKRQRMELYTSLIASQEEVIYLPDGRTFRMVINPHPLGGLLITVEDVTDRLTLERSYNTLIAVQSETLDHLHEGVVVFGSDSRLKLFNPAYARIWKLDSRMLRGEPRIHEIIDASQPLFKYDDNWEALREKLLSGVHDRTPRTGRFERADGSILDFSVVPLPDGALLFSYIDVTDSVTVQRALRERNDALLAADQLKSEFVTNVSYELRTPLNTIIGFTEILSNQYFGSLNERQGEYTRGVLEASQVLLALIDDILDLALIESGQLELEISQINIHAMLTQMTTLVQDKARKSEIALELECPEDIGTMAGDERRLKQALFNLVSNAIKYTPKGGLIRISALRTSAGLDFAVTDTGIGIAEEDQARVMGRFERGSSDRDERARGMGLGLALVKSFIELHDGQLSIASQVGEGTTVRFVIPVDDDVENAPDQ
ncbi:MAG: PAS domain-containing protein [Rhodospirillales bacterium]|nr:PAS domain-containing protein [Rhodospirillales bacterium]MBT4005857.1 PAS domain-containing protein [Rhodospirillales bacterium]MBT5075576.1 PAS domain-containing protein [Rhodospirillales bacterium]MBT5114142.1 PAS domain-containing protein [Rhodospirillales bacterium]MBT5672670.1 PAS domain-containing protein [Rhodospirillales bacterium]